MKYFKFTADTPYCGTENEYFYELGDKYATPTYLNRLAEELARDNGEGYEYLVFGWDYTLLGAGMGSSSFLIFASAIRCLGHTVAHRPQDLHLE